MPLLLFFDAIAPANSHRVGGKGASLAATFQAGLPVPPGFVITIEAYRRSDAQFAHELLAAFHQLGGAVAVRSSATAEDGADASFAGQQETILGVTTDDELLDAVHRCWESLHTERAVAYRKKQGISDDTLAMAVVVQKLVPAETAGVLFTQDPTKPSANTMIVEASYGLGEAVVSGKVTPDRFVLDHATGKLIERNLGKKTIRIDGGKEEPVPEQLQREFCLNDMQLSQLAELGRKVEQFSGNPRNIEWAIADDRVYLLQSRPITTSVLERETVRQEIISSWKSQADPRGTVWVKYNLSEILPQPTPMTWAVVQRLMAADGGIGNMNRDLGGEPDPALGNLGAFDLIAGRPMANLSRLPRLQFAAPPFEYPFAVLKADPRKALDPKPILNPTRDGFFKGLWRLPGIMRRISRMNGIARELSSTFAEKYRTQIAPPFRAEARAALAQDWSKLDSAALVQMFNLWVQKTLCDFARESLKPTFLADAAWNALVELWKPKHGEAKAREMVAESALGAKPEEDLAMALVDYTSGRLPMKQFLARFGHRGANEMELAAPRWSEVPPKLGSTPKAHTAHPAKPAENQLVEQLRTYLGLRETAKSDLLLGYAVIRQSLVTLDDRYRLNGGIFYLLPCELPELIAGTNFSITIAARRKRRQLELSLELPSVLFSDDLDAIGRAMPTPVGATSFTGMALSAGMAEGPALVLTEPTDSPEIEEGFVLVCPSTDPAWVPLFAKASALVMETGGVLSHGAIVAREFGLPAVAGLPGIVQQLRTGQRIRVEGGSGNVIVLE